MYDFLLTQTDKQDFANRARYTASRTFFECFDKAFGLGLVNSFALEIAEAYLDSERDDDCAVQVPLGNAIIIVLVSRRSATEPYIVQHSFGGLYYGEADKLLQLDIGGVAVGCFITLAQVQTSPSYVNVFPHADIVNNGVSWTRAFLETETLTKIKPASRVDQPEHEELAPSFPEIGAEIVIGVPVYNSPHLFKKLLSDLSCTLPDDSRIKIRIVDDGSDEFSYEELKIAVGELSNRWSRTIVELSPNQENKGFIRTCNELFESARASGCFILLTTDIRLPSNWLHRLIAPLMADEQAAIATPWAINGANLAVENLPGHSWRDMDILAQRVGPRHPDAETTVGYCMAVRPSALGEKESLFSLAFENGYGDDSDLYYRIVAKGLRGVIADDMVIYHYGGGSFNLLAEVDTLRTENFKVFSALWMPVYKKRIHNAVDIQNKARSTRFSRSLPKTSDILFVLPLNYRKAGGVEAVFKIVEGLRDRGVKADIYCLKHDERANDVHHEYRAVSAEDSPNIGDLPRHFGSPPFVISTSHDTAPFVQSVKTMLGCKNWSFVQGPEMAFSSGAFSSLVVDDLLKADRILCVSDYLAKLIMALTDREAVVIPYGPDPKEFYTIGQNDPKVVSVHFAGRADKGSDLAGIAVPILLKSGYSIDAFGEVSSHFQYDSRVKVHGFASASKLRRIFQCSGSYLDLSRYEGLGMLSLEALFCGAIPITMMNGGAADILRANKAGGFIQGLEDLHRLPEIIETTMAGIDLPNAMRHVRTQANINAAVERLLEVWEDAR